MSFLKHAKKNGNKFLNPVPTEMMKDKMWRVLLKYMTDKSERIPKNPLGPFTTNLTIYKTPPAGGLRITLIGHSSLLIEIDGKRLLTDPVWAERVSPVSFAGPKRFFAA
ncbi:MAG: MBL fold metallo-hydrolase, partial [Flavipsychrobacter sp.]